MPTPAAADWPPYCCIILRDAGGQYLLERRPGSARLAPGTLTCFGGSRERDESPLDCIARELIEELGPAAAKAVQGVELRVIVRSRTRLIAWFFGAAPMLTNVPLVCEPGYFAVWLSEAELEAAPLARWHRAALLADRRKLGEILVDD